MTNFLSFLDTAALQPQGYLLWRLDLVWATVLADLTISAAYFSTSIGLVYFAMKRSDLAFPLIFFLFGAFILLCGTTHIMETVTFWWPLYGWETLSKIATAIVSFVTAMALWRLMPHALALPSVAQLHGVNTLLEREVVERQAVEDALRAANVELEQRVAERTAALTRLTHDLQAEIAERAHVEDGLRASTDLLQATFDAAPFPICVERPDSTLMMWNKAAERDFGFRIDEPAPLRHRLRHPDPDRGAADELFRRAASGESLRNIQTSLLNEADNLLEINFSCAPVREPDGRMRAVVYILEDVTQRNIIEAQLRQAQKMEAIGSLTGGMAHDFNNLLAVVIGNLEAVEGDIADDPRNKPRIADAMEAALRGADLTRRLLAFARRQPLHPQQTDLSTVVSRTMALLARTLGKHIALNACYARDPLLVLIDKAQLEAAVTNLATNARDAMPRGGTLMVRTAQSHLDADYARQHPEVQAGDYAMVEMCDTGTGIDTQTITRIFEPFFTTKPEGRGSGLGLAMVFGFLKQSGGHINVYSEPGQGACFRIYLPLATPTGAAASSPQPNPPTQRGKEHVLVVEDNERLRHIVIVQLRSLGYHVSEADNVATALRILQADPSVELLFTDVVMAGDMSGSELAVAAIQLLPGIKVIFTSGFPEARADSSGWNDGGFKLLAKPYRKEELARTVRMVLDAG